MKSSSKSKILGIIVSTKGSGILASPFLPLFRPLPKREDLLRLEEEEGIADKICEKMKITRFEDFKMRNC